MKKKKDNKYKLSIIIVNWNTAQFLKKCIQSIYDYSPRFQFEIIVFDNGSTEDCRTVLKNFPDVKAILHPDNLGFTAACNRAAKLSDGEFLLFLNPDTEISYDVLSPSVEFLQTQDFSILGVRLILPDGCVQISSGNFPSLNVSIFQNLYLFLGKIGLKFHYFI